MALGALTLQAQHHYVALRDAGEALNGMATLLATGPSAVTAWPGWLAAGCFALALRRLRTGSPEPPAGRDAVRTTVAELRAGLRREYRVVRAVLWVLSAGVLLDAGRLLWFCLAALGGGLARGELVALTLEVAGLAAAALVLRRWLRHFAGQLDQLGAL